MKVCPACGGNDQDAPCSYPGEAQKGCLRDKRLRDKLTERLKTTPTKELWARIKARIEESKR